MENNEFILAYEDTHLPELLSNSTGMHYLEQQALSLIGESGDYDIMATWLGYVVGGRAWGTDRQNTRLSCFIAVPKSFRGKMHDNDFFSNRVDPIKFTGDFNITKSPDNITLDIAGQKLIARPSLWELKGEPHNDVKFDITCQGVGPVNWSLGRFEDIVKNGMAGYDQGITVSGSVTANGIEYKIDPGAIGTRAYYTIGDNWIQGDTGKRYSKHSYIFFTTPEASALIWEKEAMNLKVGRTVVDGVNMSFDPENIKVEETEHWVDPRTGLYIPVKWHATMKGENGYADLEIVAYARYIYSFCQSDGIVTYVAKLCRTNGVIVQNGRKVELKDARTQVETGIFTIPLGVG